MSSRLDIVPASYSDDEDENVPGEVIDLPVYKPAIAPLNVNSVTISCGTPTVNVYHPRFVIVEAGNPIINIYCNGATVVLRGGSPDVRCYDDTSVNFRVESVDYVVSI
jgi:hypothetical protein